MDETLRRLVWEWIINHNDHSYDVDDLIGDLERTGYPCPPDLDED